MHLILEINILKEFCVQVNLVRINKTNSCFLFTIAPPLGAVPQFGFISSGGYWYPPNNSCMFFYRITNWSCKKNGPTAQTLLANISQMELSKTNSVH